MKRWALLAGAMICWCVAACSPALAGPATAPATQRARELTLDLGNKVTLKLVQIPAGKFLMGSPKDDRDRKDHEGLQRGRWIKGSPQFEVTISKPFYMGIYEVTVAQYAQFVKDSGYKTDAEKAGVGVVVMKVGEFDVKQPDPWSWRNPGFDQKDDHPVLQVSRNDAQAFCAWVSKKTGKTVVLPTEAQWEYACRAGTQTRFSFGDEDADLGDYAWYARNSMDEDKGANMTHPVGQKKPNAWGLYDMHGNAEERCADYYGEYAGAGADPTGPKGGSFHVLRGGSWMNDPGRCRSANRFSVQLGQDSNSGFRVAMVAAGVGLP